MTPAVWGPIFWALLFTIAWHARERDMPCIREFMLELVPRLLPCHECRLHFRIHRPQVKKRAQGELKNAEHTFRWLYYLKDEVNQTLNQRSPKLKELRARYALGDRAPTVDDGDLADMLVLVAIEAKRMGRAVEFARFCLLIYELVPHTESPLRAHLHQGTSDNITQWAINTANAVRTYYERPNRTHRHFQEWGDA